MQLDQIWQYPVKSMLGARVECATLADNGIGNDRLWALRDEARGAIASGRKLAGVNRLSASYATDGTSVVITLPDGTSAHSSDGDIDARLTAAVGHPVSLWSHQPATNTDFYRRGAPDSDDFMAELRSIFGRLPDEPLPDLSIFPPEMMEFEYPPGNFFDCYPLMIMTTSALGSMREALPDSAIDERRFRPSLVIDTGEATGHPEFEWVGRRIRVGASELQIGSACPRCVMVTREFAPDLPVDQRVLRHVVRDLDQNVGVYATIVRGGAINVGDSVELL